MLHPRDVIESVDADRRPTGDALVHRDTERLSLGCAVAGAAAGRPHLVVVEAEAGMGKSALLEQVLAGHPDVGTWCRVRCAEFEQTLTYGVADLVLGGDHDLARSSRVDVGRRLLRRLGELQDGTPRAVALVVDDAHWMDRASAEALRFALRRLRADRVLCVVAGRPVNPLTAVTFATVPSAAMTTTVLRPGPLDAGAVAELARRARAWDLPEGTATRLVDRTSGVPLLVAACLRAAHTPEQLDVDGDVPASVAEAALGMLASVGPPTRRLVEALAVVDAPIELTVLAAIAGVAEAATALAPAVTAGLVRVDDQGRATCAHALLQSAIHATLPLDRRRELHARAAARTTGARHLAHRVGAADRPDPGLATELVEAAAAARRARDHTRAATHRLDARRVSEHPALRDRLLLEALVDRVEGQDLAGAAELAPAALATGPGALRSRALGLLARERGEIGPARTWLRDALDVAAASGAEEARARAALALAVLDVRLGEGTAAAELLAGVDPPDDPELATDVTTTTALGLWQGQEPGRAAALLAGVAVGPHGSPWEAELVGARGMFSLYSGDLDAALADLDTAIGWAHLWRPSTNQARMYLLRAKVRYLLGDWDGASGDLTAGRGLARSSTEVWSAPLVLATSVDVPAHRGRWEEAAAHLAHAEDALGGFAPDLLVDHVLAHRLVLAAARGDHPAVLDALDPRWSPPYVERLRHHRVLHDVLPARIPALLAVGRLADAEADIDSYGTAVVRGGGAPPPHRRQWMRGLLAEAHGRLDRACEHHDAELADPRLARTPFLLAQALEARGRVARDAGRRREAVAHLDRAREIYLRLGATPSLERCRDELADCGVVRERPDHSGLTPREQDVVALVIRGDTNKEIAAELYLTVKTVEFHLRNVYAKLGVANRRELQRRRTPR
jgi:ATP/maltotriose-dependent transcriptional regulator MalT